jgi:hypothetical protein
MSAGASLGNIGNERKLRTDLSAIALAKGENLNGYKEKKETLSLDWPQAEQITVPSSLSSRTFCFKFSNSHSN